MPRMGQSRTLPRIIITFVCAVLGASVGVCFQALRITGRPQEFRSLAKVVAGGQMVSNDSINWREQQADFYGTIIETLESAEMQRRALERVRALNPDLRDADVEIRVAQTKGSAIFNILATGSEPKYTKIFLDALLDEFIAFRQSIREQAGGRVLQQFLQEVVSQQKKMEMSLEALEKARAKAESLSARADQERLVNRLTKLKDQRDDLRLELKPLATNEPSRAALDTKMVSIEQDISTVEAGLGRYEPGLSELRRAVEQHAVAKETYEKLFAHVDQLQSLMSSNSDYVAIQERATPAAENVEDWTLPIGVGAIGGGFLGVALGTLLSLVLMRSPAPPPLPPAA
jgi:hypothetical protein